MWAVCLEKNNENRRFDLICKNSTNIITLVLKRSFQDRVSNLEFALRDILSHVILLLIKNSFHNSKLLLLMFDGQRLQYLFK